MRWGLSRCSDAAGWRSRAGRSGLTWGTRFVASARCLPCDCLEAPTHALSVDGLLGLGLGSPVAVSPGATAPVRGRVLKVGQGREAQRSCPYRINALMQREPSGFAQPDGPRPVGATPWSDVNSAHSSQSCWGCVDTRGMGDSGQRGITRASRPDSPVAILLSLPSGRPAAVEIGRPVTRGRRSPGGSADGAPNLYRPSGQSSLTRVRPGARV